MTSIAKSPANHMLFYSVSWDVYTRLLEAFGDQRLHHTYDEGTLEMMSPLTEHEWTKRLIGRFIDALTIEFDIPIKSVGSTTLRREAARKGLEPDECYYIQHEAAVRGRRDYDPDRDPPPDLAIEVDVTHKSLDRMSVYAAIGIPEVWRATKDGVLFYRLNRSGRYSKLARSRALPLFTPAVIDEFLALRTTKSETALVRQFAAWVRTAKRKTST